MKKIIYITFLFLTMNSYSQKYFPKLNNLIFQNAESESLFSTKTLYFKEALKATTNKLFYKNLQTSTGTNTSFYSLSIIPRFIFEYNFFDTGNFIKFNAKSKDEFPSFPIIINENKNNETKVGSGSINIGNDGLSLLFDKNQIKSLDSLTKKENLNTKAEFKIEKIDYKINENDILIELTGNFITDIKVAKSKIIRSNVSKLLINVEKEKFTISLINLLNNKEIIIVEKKITSN